MERELRIALLTDGIFPFVIGGMQKHSWYLARYLARRGVKVDLYFFRDQDPESPAFTAEELEKITLIELKFPKMGDLPGHYIRESLEFSQRIFNKMKGDIHKYDLIYAKGFTAWVLLDARRKGLKCPPIAVNFHGYEMFQKAPSLKVWLSYFMLRSPVKFCMQEADIAISYGGKITGILKELQAGKKGIWEIPTGIEATWLIDKVRRPERPYRFLFVGRYERRKGIEELNLALKKLLPELNIEFHFIGPIPPTKHLRSEKVIYHGKIMNQDKMQELVRSCDVLVTPSHSEGMPNVIMESMASGLAIIATDVGAVGVMVGNDNGWLIPPRDKTALENALRAAAGADESSLLAKKQSSVDKVRERFTWDHIIDLTLEKIEAEVLKTESV